MAESDLDAAIAALWRDARERVLGRVATIEAALDAAARGALDGAQRDGARQEAHRLAGALGTFGMPEGSDRARVVERALEDEVGPADAAALREELVVLRRVVEAGPRSS